MYISNFIDEEILLLERPNIRKKCCIKSDIEMKNYIVAYNVYNNLLIQFLIDKFSLNEAEQELEKHIEMFPKISNNMKDLYQKSSEGYLNYFYLRNNIYIERLSSKDIGYLLEIYNSKNLKLDGLKKKFIEKTYLNVILENPSQNDYNINFGPNNSKFIKPSNAIIIGVRYNKFNELLNEKNGLEIFANAQGKLQILTEFLEYKARKEQKIPFYIIEYDDYSVNIKKNVTKINQSFRK